MTKAYDQLREGPTTGIDRGELAPDERTAVRTVRASRSSASDAAFDGNLTTVYYLAGNARGAARRFVEINRSQLEGIDFSNRDVIQSTLDREVYDWVLHFLGVRELRKYRTVVYECRPDGTEWVIGRERFDETPSKRYRIGGRAAKVTTETDVETLYEESGTQITKWALEDHGAVRGSARQLLEYYRVAGTFDCVPVDDGRNPVLEKR